MNTMISKAVLTCHAEHRSAAAAAAYPHPEDARLALIIGLGALALTGLIGIIFLLVWGWELLPLGLLGMVLIYTYTN